MSLSSVCLPDGRTYTVQPVFGGLFFKNDQPSVHPLAFPDGWTIALHTVEAVPQDLQTNAVGDGHQSPPVLYKRQRYRCPTLQNDTIFISSIFNTSNHESQPHGSSSREIALMLWTSLYWYFQQTEPAPYIHSEKTKLAPPEAKPKGEWRIKIERDGVFRTKNIIPKLERMGLIMSSDTSVDSGLDGKENGWDEMFVTRRMFWQIPSSLFLPTLQPLKPLSSYPGSPVPSRPLSPVSNDLSQGLNLASGLLPAASDDSSILHLPTYYPPPPLQYVMTNNIRHPRRPKPPRMGEIFYSRYVPSVEKHLSFRVASLSPNHVPHLGWKGNTEKQGNISHLCTQSDSALLKMWLSKPRVSAFWGEYYDNFLPDAMKSQNSFPAIGLWDGVPFGYFEIYWVKEDLLGRHMGHDAQDFDRGLHVLVGEEWARGKVTTWLSSLVQWCWQADNRTMNVYLEPRVDNTRFIEHLQNAGFAKDRQVALPHKQSWICRLRRETWEGPAL